MVVKHRAYLLLGSNISPRNDYLNSAKELIEREIGDIQASSSVYESEPWGFEAEQCFLNEVLAVDTVLNAGELLNESQKIEKRLGRMRKSNEGYSSRTLDIDILFFDDAVLLLPGLTIPHVQIQNRRFTLMPLVEIAPDFKHPLLDKSCRQLLKECKDCGKVWKIQSSQFHEI